MVEGRSAVGAGAHLGPDVRLVDCVVGQGATLEKTVGYDAEVGAHAVVGPFAVLRPGSHILPGTTTGAFYTARASDDEEL
jgi:bifunctional UDP-N-acetylglucosamine pyrophosphorylase/glucosamine-1-phosphate N-acetyltransferase